MEAPKPQTTHLHIVNMVVALIAGIISIVGGIYSLKANVFSSNNGSVQGTVLDDKIAKPLWHAAVEVSESDAPLISTTETNENGGYSFKALKKGDYVVKVSAPFHKPQAKAVKVERNRVSVINFDLTPLPHEPPAPSTQENQANNNIIDQPSRAVPYASLRDTRNELAGNAANQLPAQFVRRRLYYRSKAPQWETPDASQITTPTQNSEDTGNSSPASSSSIGQVLTQTGVQLVEEWLSKKSENKTA